jgi:hypothetical protein
MMKRSACFCSRGGMAGAVGEVCRPGARLVNRRGRHDAESRHTSRPVRTVQRRICIAHVPPCATWFSDHALARAGMRKARAGTWIDTRAHVAGGVVTRVRPRSRQRVATVRCDLEEPCAACFDSDHGGCWAEQLPMKAGAAQDVPGSPAGITSSSYAVLMEQLFPTSHMRSSLGATIDRGVRS